MEKETVMNKSPRPSIWDPFEGKVKEYRELGVPKASIYKIINQELRYKGGYDGFWRWAKKRGID